MKPVTQYNIDNGPEITTATNKPSGLEPDLTTTKPVTDKVSLVRWCCKGPLLVLIVTGLNTTVTNNTLIDRYRWGILVTRIMCGHLTPVTSTIAIIEVGQ